MPTPFKTHGRRVATFMVALVLVPASALAQRAPTERPVQRNLVTHHLFGKWVVDTGLTLRLGGGALRSTTPGTEGGLGGAIEFVEDSAVARELPPAMAERLKAFSVRKSGHVSLGAARYPFLMVVDSIGNSNVLYFLPRGSNPYGNGESFLLSVIPGKEPSDDLLFIGGDFSHEPFSAFRRPGSQSTKY